MKIRKAIQLIMCAAVLTASTASAESIPGLFNTGVNNSGERLPSGTMEQHYMLTGVATTAYVFYEGAPISDPGVWVTPSAGAMWIGPNGGDLLSASSGEYIYTLSFDLTGLDPTNAWIFGQWSSDNESTIYLNGVPTGFTTDDFHYLHDFTINEGFLPSINNLEFHVTNDRFATGLLVQNLHGESVPEPATLLLLGLGAVVLRKKRSQSLA